MRATGPLIKSQTEPRVLPPCSFVLPCLNEAQSLPAVLRRIEVLRDRFSELEVIVVDNGSDDGTTEHARGFQTRIIHCERRGYGAALHAGIEQASHDTIVFADADNTYDWHESVNLVEALLVGDLDLVVGNRLRGKLQPQAMPFLNRRLGTPFLSFLITILFGRHRNILVGDCNGGMRAFRKSAFLRWGTRSSGMEFASEMIVRALLHDARYLELPISYRKPLPGRRSHVRRWRDGLRHLREILYVYYRAGRTS